MKQVAKAGKDFFIAPPRPQASCRLICFPYAAGAPWTYRDWSASLPEVELCTACLPGRGARSHEPPATDMTALLAAYLPGVAAWARDKPYALFGHSFGALMSWGLAQLLQQHGHPPPAHVFLSACAPPDIDPPKPPAEVDDEAFLALMGSRNGLPDTVLQNPALRTLAISALRADLHLASTFRPAPTVLEAPLTAFYGTQDIDATEIKMQGWRRHSRSRFSLHAVEGGHFFLHTQHARLLRTIRQALRLSPDDDAPADLPRQTLASDF